MRAENTREISRVHEKGESRSHRRGGKWVMVMARGKINSRTYPGSNTRPTGPVKPGSPLSSKIRRYSITVRLRRPRRIKSSYESHVIDVADFDDGRDFRTTREIRHYVDFSIFVSGFLSRDFIYYGIYNLACEKNCAPLI